MKWQGDHGAIELRQYKRESVIAAGVAIVLLAVVLGLLAVVASHSREATLWQNRYLLLEERLEREVMRNKALKVVQPTVGLYTYPYMDERRVVGNLYYYFETKDHAREWYEVLTGEEPVMAERRWVTMSTNGGENDEVDYDSDAGYSGTDTRAGDRH